MKWFVLLLVLGLGLMPSGSAITYPLCSSFNNLLFEYAYNDASGTPGAFTVAGCTHPFGSSVKVWFADNYGNPISGLPTELNPRVLVSRTTDGHFHVSYVVSCGAFQIIANADNGMTQRAAFFTFRNNLSPMVSGNSSLDSNAIPSIFGPGVIPYNYFAGNCASAGTFGFQLFSSYRNGTLALWFVNKQTFGSIPGLPSESLPWYGRANWAGIICCPAFVVPGENGLDLTQPNLLVYQRTLNDGGTGIIVEWWHRYVSLSSGGGGGCRCYLV